ncbi:hypothetical protein INT48_000214 [Thamnidium elegans]|uniref:Uncharacterized protein n=1 Tax=Thamnidium elegans TaxID=101142 RepID=A0A8H7SW70_9FUNG|nr:hypothetical protein INT48_000214 [Thamnidium elegans]
MATAFIHLLPESFIRFQSECLTGGWHSYRAYGGLFCMSASFALQPVELTATSSLEAIAKINVGVNGLHTEEKGQIGLDTKEQIRSDGFLENDERVRNVSTFILELGITLHSAIIGITLGTIDRETFNTLLVALVFHQFFEGIALGTRINDLNSQSLVNPIIMDNLFSVMTPIGVAIGMGD